MNALQKKQLAFLEDTVAHYNSNNRSENDNGGCKYYPATPQSKGCAIGRHINEKLAKKLDLSDAVGVSNSDVFNQLPKKLKYLGQDFLEEIQDLHDKTWLWDKKGITDEGKRVVDRIKTEFNLN